jgi:SAM-dependent methyltransferase
MMKRILFPALLLTFLLPAASQSVDLSPHVWNGEGRPDVHYVPTPPEVVSEMLRLADVGESDLVYDLGSGDGRIVIAAAREKGAKGVGIDIDPLRVEEGRRNAVRAGVSDRVEFIQGDLFSADFSDATVVTLYLLPDLNLRLRPRILEELRPGTRVVSHAFHMGEWSPDEESSISRHSIFFWVVPANVSGSWELSAPGAQGDQRYELQIDQDFQNLEVVLKSDSGLLPASRADLTGDRLELSFDEEGGLFGKALLFEGRIDGDVIVGTMRSAEREQAPWRAVRVAQTREPLDEGR